LGEVVEKYKAGETTIKEYVQAVQTLQYNSNALTAVKEFIEKDEYIQHIEEDDQANAWMISDRGYEQILGQYGKQREFIILMALVIGIMLIISESVVMEYRTGMEYVVRTGSRGRSWRMKRKIAACILFTISLTAIVYVIDLWNMKHIYGLPYLNAPAISLRFLEGVAGGLALHSSIGGWILMRIAIRTVIVLATMTLGIIVSRVMGKKGNRALVPMLLVGLVIALVIMNNLGWLI
jgi:hypothetical protein